MSSSRAVSAGLRRPTVSLGPLPHRRRGGDAAGVAAATADDDAHVEQSWRELLVGSLALFGHHVLGLEVADFALEWCEDIERYARLARLAPRDHGKSVWFTYAYPIWRAWGDPRCEVYLFSATLDQAMEFVDIILYGKNNLKGLVDIPELEHLVPNLEDFRKNPRVRLNRADVVLTNGSRIRAAGYGKKMRGRHPKYVVLDDVLNDEDMWSEAVRKKNIAYFQSAISNMVMPSVQYADYFEGGQCLVVGTPFAVNDLYGYLRDNASYNFRKYSAIIRDGGVERALFPWRWSLEQLRAKRKEIGAVAFAREIECEPISEDMRVFPSHLFEPLYDKLLCLRPSKELLRARGIVAYGGVDIARSATVGADFFVIYVLGKDAQGGRYILDIVRSKGLPFRRQLEQIALVSDLYDCALVNIEANAMQQIYTQEMRRLTDVPVKEFVTLASNKYPLDRGVPGLRILLENEKLRIPRGDAYSIEMTDIWMGEMQSFGFVDGKLQGVGSHDDTVMAFWMAEEAARSGGFSFAFDEQRGSESFDQPEDKDGGEDYRDVLLGGRAERGDDDASLFGE